VAIVTRRPIPAAAGVAADATQAQTALALDATPRAELTLFPQEERTQFWAAEANWEVEAHSQASCRLATWLGRPWEASMEGRLTVIIEARASDLGGSGSDTGHLD
jgi:hypothetical protein